MKIGLDTTLINKPDGAGRYTREMLRYLCKNFPQEEFIAFGPVPELPIAFPNLQYVTYFDVRNIVYRLLYALQIHKLLRRHGVDVFHNLTNYGIYRSPCPMVTTVLDLLTYKYPTLRGSRFQGLLYRYYLPSLLKRAQHIIAISQNTRDDLLSCYGIQDRVSVVYLGYDSERFYPGDGSGEDIAVLDKYGLIPGYILFVGYLIPKKNIETVVHALGLLRSRFACQARLVMVGKQGNGGERVIELVEQMGLTDRVQVTGFLPDDELGAIYRNARVFVFPSIYEGFGLPVVEAMACGTPVLVSDGGSLPELVEREDCMCPAQDVGAWAEKLFSLLEDDGYHENMVRHVLNRAKIFSWDACVHETVNVYRRVLRSGANGRI
jgi:glycosyltransferase involved in cell wall biosynthesis